MPVRNGARFIAEGVASALAEIGAGDELIVIDDGSTDATAAIVAAYADPRVKLISTPPHGVSAARNRGLAEARGEFIAFLDHDDLWPPGRHAALLAALDQDASADSVCGRLRVKYEPGSVRSAAYVAMDGQLFPNGLLSPSLFRRAIIDRVDGFAEQMTQGEDTDFLARLRAAGMRVALIERDAIIYRRHDANATNQVGEARAGRFEVLRRKLQRDRESGRGDGG